ncbi:SRPBCC family protein [soil metagenome]
MALTVQPLADNPALDQVRATLAVNVGDPERIGSVAAGAGLVLYGLARRSLGGVLLAVAGGLLVRRGIIGYCPAYEQLDINSARFNGETGVPGNKGIKVTRSIIVDRAPQDVYRFWRNLENLPRFMEHVQSVRNLDDVRSHWVVKGPAGTEVEWTAQIITDHENSLIGWESLPGAEVQNAGSVRFEPVNNGQSTEVKVSLQYQPPGGVLGAAVAKLFGEAPDQQLDTDLQRFKEVLGGQAA